MTGADRDLVKVWEKMNSHRFEQVMLQTKAVDVQAKKDGIWITFEGQKAPSKAQCYDLILVAVGRVPNGKKIGAHLAGVQVDDRGFISVDQQMRTNVSNIFAIGDCAAHANAFAGGNIMRVESVQNANDMANAVAKSLTGELTQYHAVPWFWSNQYDLRLQTVGISAGYDTTILRGDPDARSFSLIYLKAGKVIALDCVNATKDYVQGRLFVTDGLSPTGDQLADTAVTLKELAAELAAT
jgi:3-phenylpropionate/trans-cinnamate dioxygenase ferredoxin reductase subunit